MPKTIFGDPDNLWEKYSAAGDRAFKKQEYKEAETLWLNALRIAQDLSRSQYMLHVSLIRLSLLYNVMGKDSESNELLRWSRRLWDVHYLNVRVQSMPGDVGIAQPASERSH